MKALWERIRAGKHTVVIGTTVPTPESDDQIELLRIACDRPGGPFGPILDAWHKALTWLGADGPTAGSSAELRAGLRKQLLGARQLPGDAFAAVVDVLNQLASVAAAVGRPCALVMEAADRTDEGTLAILTRIVEGGRLELPLVVQAGTAPTSGALADLIAAVKATSTKALIKPRKKAAATDWSPDALPFECRQLLRVAATMGPAFDVELVATVAEVTEATVLAELQRAADSGLPIEDSGSGHLRIPESVIASLLDGVLPSVLAAWHQRAGRHLTGETAAAAGRAAAHFERAGEFFDAAERSLETAISAAAGGAHEEGLLYVERGLNLLGRAPNSAERHALEIRLRAERARLIWEASGPDRDFTLQSALESALAADELLEDGDAAFLKAEVWALVAQIQYDIGTSESLEDALNRLTAAARVLDADGQQRAAARLLNDQAAVWVRIGDPLRAAELLDASRKVFSRLADDDEVSAVELADTEHLLARLPLHVPARPGFEDEAIGRSVQRARSAARMYERLGDRRGTARAWETTGRLHLLGGDVDEASRWLTRAVEVQQQSCDVIGLARTAEALSRLLARQGNFDAALQLLVDSLTLNVEKGAFRGIEYLQTTLADLTDSMDDETRAASSELLAAVDDQLGRAKERIATRTAA